MPTSDVRIAADRHNAEAESDMTRLAVADPMSFTAVGTATSRRRVMATPAGADSRIRTARELRADPRDQGRLAKAAARSEVQSVEAVKRGTAPKNLDPALEELGSFLPSEATNPPGGRLDGHRESTLCDTRPTLRVPKPPRHIPEAGDPLTFCKQLPQALAGMSASRHRAGLPSG